MTGKMAHNPERLPPIHPGEILNEEFLLPMKITQYRLAKAIGVDARRIHSIVHGQRSITAETALLLARFFGNSPAFWMGLQTQYDLETAKDRLSHRLEMVEDPLPLAPHSLNILFGAGFLYDCPILTKDTSDIQSILSHLFADTAFLCNLFNARSFSNLRKQQRPRRARSAPS